MCNTVTSRANQGSQNQGQGHKVVKITDICRLKMVDHRSMNNKYEHKTFCRQTDKTRLKLAENRKDRQSEGQFKYVRVPDSVNIDLFMTQTQKLTDYKKVRQ